MTVQKKHISTDGVARKCEATTRPCQYGDSPHFYHDSSINKEVLPPEHSTQQKINSVSSEDLLKEAPNLIPAGKEPSPEYAKYHALTEKATANWEKQREYIIKSYPVKTQDAVRSLARLPEGAGAIASFELFDPEEEDGVAKSSATEEEKMQFAKVYLDKVQAEQKLRASISAMHV